MGEKSEGQEEAGAGTAQRGINTTKSNTFRTTDPDDPGITGPGEPSEAINLNSSKSNVYRNAIQSAIGTANMNPGDPGEPPAGGEPAAGGGMATVQGHSNLGANVYRTMNPGDPGGPPPGGEPAQAATVKASKSNSQDRTMNPDPGEPPPGGEPAGGGIVEPGEPSEASSDPLKGLNWTKSKPVA